MVGKTFKGLTDELLRWQTEPFLAVGVRGRITSCGVRPEFVVEIAIDGVQRPPAIPAGLRCASPGSAVPRRQARRRGRHDRHLRALLNR